MEKTLIIYKSKYGATRKYVDMLQGEIACDVCNLKDLKTNNFKSYQCIVFMGGVYASGIAGMKILRKNYHLLKDKKIAVFAVGASPFDEKAFKELKNHNLKDDFKHIPLYYGRGAFCESQMTFRDRTLCQMLKKSVSKKDPATYEPWEEALISSFGKDSDWTDKKYLTPLITFIKSTKERL